MAGSKPFLLCYSFFLEDIKSAPLALYALEVYQKKIAMVSPWSAMQSLLSTSDIPKRIERALRSLNAGFYGCHKREGLSSYMARLL